MKIASSLLIGLLSASLVHAHGDERHAPQTHAENTGHAAAMGQPGDPAKATRTIEVRMSDAMRFTPASIKVGKGETIRFLVKNEGQIKHELVLGTLSELREHAELMRKFPEMEHDDPNAVTVEPGKTGELVWHFSKAGNFDFACLVPGHFEAGMRGTVTVSGN
jgi:uncharacterized cupredoxin-like copper-binding protein